MGHSHWHHLDFKEIESETDKHLYVLAETGVRYMINKRFVADRNDYQAGNKNGTISIHENHAEKLGLL